jgi:hypothetical protein
VAWGVAIRCGWAERVLRAVGADLDPCIWLVGPTLTGHAAADVFGGVPRYAQAVCDGD